MKNIKIASCVFIIVYLFGVCVYAWKQTTPNDKTSQKIVTNPVNWAKLVSVPARVVDVGMLWQANFQFSDSETLTAVIVDGGNIDRAWKIGDKVFISSVLGKGHQNQPAITYIIVDHRYAAEADSK